MKTWQKLRQNQSLFYNHSVREQVVCAIREYFQKQKFHEAELPLLTPTLPAESYVEVFETTLLNRRHEPNRAFLTTSPEMSLKKLLVAGIGSCYSICKSFRNTEDMSDTHNPEFTILEWYRVGADYKDVMKDVEELFCYIYDRIYSSIRQLTERSVRKNNNDSSHIRSNNKYLLKYQCQTIDLTPPWERISMVEAFAKYARVDLLQKLNEQGMKQAARSKGYSTERATWEELFHQIYLSEVVPQFAKSKPTIIYDYPVQLAALAAKAKADDPRLCERFEVYIAGIEIADCCSELTDWREQERRFKKEIKEIRKSGKTDYPVDREFIEALKLGLPKCAGIALGVDRLVMLFANAKTIQDVLYFPASEMWG